jgi:hypothetical protein
VRVALIVQPGETWQNLAQHFGHKTESIASSFNSIHPYFKTLTTVCHENFSNALPNLVTQQFRKPVVNLTSLDYFKQRALVVLSFLVLLQQ